MATTVDTIVSDVFENHRTFLPGPANTREGIIRSMKGDLYIDGVKSEEAQLMLSTLPRDVQRLQITPMDKSLSGSRVFAVRYRPPRGPLSKPFVFKVGKLEKIDQEAEAVERLVAPYLEGIDTPIRRRGVDLGLIGQELHGLREDATPESLRLHVRHSDRAPQVVTRLLEKRLAGWYQHEDRQSRQPHRLSEMFEWYRKKMLAMPNAGSYPEGWEDLQIWVEDSSGLPWLGMDAIDQMLAGETVISPATIVHGDLHSQNVLVECQQGECWPIDFAWCQDQANPALDFVMLECSVKFLSVPMRSDLQSLLGMELDLLDQPYPSFRLGRVPYRPEISNAWNTVMAVRRYALDNNGISFDDYRKCLCFMTYTLSNHPGLNLPYVLSSLQMASSLIDRAG